MAWVPLKETPLISLLQKMIELQASAMELASKELLNSARTRAINVRGLQHMRKERKENKIRAAKEKDQHGTN